MAIQSLGIILIVLLFLLALGVPIAYSIGISALLVILKTVPLDVSVVTAAQRTFVGMSKFSLTAIPFFILAGNLMNQGGIAKRLVDFVMALLGKLPGALLVTNAGANALFGAISGSASAAAAAVGSMVKEGEEEQGYDPALCAATNGASAPSGLLIMNVILLIAGTFMDVTPAILIFTPLFLPIVKTFGMHPVHFGLILVYNLCIGNITPPVGNTLFVAIKIGNTTLSRTIPYMLWYYTAILAGLLLVTYVPFLSTGLPLAAGLI